MKFKDFAVIFEFEIVIIVLWVIPGLILLIGGLMTL